MSNKSSKLHICRYNGCNKVFSRPGRLLQHIRSHTGERPYKCTHDGCERSYARSQHLLRHTLVSHRPTESDTSNQKKAHVCENCNGNFSNKHNLEKHKQRHHGEEKNYMCPEKDCSEGFRKKHQLRAHLFKHQGVLPFQCAVPGCLKRFSQSSHLQSHRKSHQGYNCSEEGCDITFSKMSELRKHKAIEHRKVRRCDKCEKCFHRPSDLANHQVVHDAEREKYKCPSCERTYFAKRNLKSHIRHHHSGLKFTCLHEGCGISLSTKQKLLHHRKIHKRCEKKKPRPKNKKRSVLRLVKYINGKKTDSVRTKPQASGTVSNPEYSNNTDEDISKKSTQSCESNTDVRQSSLPTIPQKSQESSSHAQAMMGLQETGFRDLATENSTEIHGNLQGQNEGQVDLKVTSEGHDKDDLGKSPQNKLLQEDSDVDLDEGSSEILSSVCWDNSYDSSSLGFSNSELESDSSVALDLDIRGIKRRTDSHRFSGDKTFSDSSSSSDSITSKGDINQSDDLESLSQEGDIKGPKRATTELSNLGNPDLEEGDKSGAHNNRDQCSYVCDGAIDHPVTGNKGAVLSAKATQGHKPSETSQQIENKRQMSFKETQDPLKTEKTNSRFVIKEIQLSSSSFVRFVSSQK